ncbi:hypothetical protein JonanDRAFT_1236 [Jonquetella anthropi DSM 22815]|uniref:Ribbon-helix-helix protein, copG family n=1 Tax=Jonquetella anthropi DSM 22815 TaxID=885272 RepID=H0ULW1_9BACT|nr:DUF6290 family protein [Jonquetella anthropi]EHM13602.1 hypothetical protein JonanDRAFT_1236 [Jonquetella anthropi DSM 22815]
MSSITIRVTEREKTVLENFAAERQLTVSQLLRQSALDRVEDEYDLAIYQEYLARRDKEYIPFEEAVKEWY